MTAVGLVEQWTELLRVAHSLGQQELLEREGALHRATLAALTAGGRKRDALVAAFRGARDTDPELRRALEGVVLPPHEWAARHPDEYRAHPEVDFDADRMPLRVALGLPVAEDLTRDPAGDPLAHGRSWFGGRPALPADEVASWSPPQRYDGRPLAHVVQVDLAEEADNIGPEEFAATGLPSEGTIHLFHDFETTGREPSDDPTGWRVLWRPARPASAGESELVVVPPAEGDELRSFYPINAQALPTVPSPLDLADADKAESSRYDRAGHWLEQLVHHLNVLAVRHHDHPTPWDDDHEPLPPVSRMGGFGHTGDSEELRAVLTERLPLTGDDRHVLLFDISPQAIAASAEPADCFHAGGHLEVWMRQGDLEARVFDDVWCVVRNDG